MLAPLALASLAPLEMRLPTSAHSPDAINSGGAIHVVHEENQNGWCTRHGSTGRVMINSQQGTVQAGPEGQSLVVH